MKLLIVHLSDIHLHIKENPAVAKFPFITKALQNEEVQLDGVIVVVAGDIAYSGKADEYKLATENLSRLQKELAEKTKVDDVRFIFVPGNHDCDIEKGGNARETIISAIRKGVSAPIDGGMIDLCCGVQHEFFEFRDSFPTAKPTRAEGRIYWEHLFEKGDIKVLFRCYNTAWISQHHEQQGGLLFPEQYLSDKAVQAKADYSIAVFHHPYNWLPAASYRYFRGHIEKFSDLILTGHEHEPEHYQKYTFRGEVNEYLEGAVFQEEDLDLKKTYLSELAYWMFFRKIKRIVDGDWMRFHGEYCAKYKIKPSREALKRDFVDSGLFEQLDAKFEFRHAYAYYYFVARYFRDNIAQAEVRTVLESLCGKLNNEEYASIWLFLTHLSKDPFIVEVILKHARKTFERFKPAEFAKDVEFLGELAKSIERVALEDREFGDIKEDRLRRLDSAPSVPELEPDSGDGEAETNEALKLIAELTLALRTLEVLGQIIKNFPGSLVGADKYALVKECYELGLRTVSMILDLFQNNSSGFIDFVIDRVAAKHPDIIQKNNRDDLERKLKSLLFWMIETCCFGIIKRISQSVGHSQLSETYREVRESMDTNSVALIDISVQLDNLGIPDEYLKELNDRFKGSVLCDRLLRQLVVQHFYLFPTKEPVKQKVCAMLKIPIHNLRGIDVKSKQEKLAPPKK